MPKSSDLKSQLQRRLWLTSTLGINLPHYSSTKPSSHPEEAGGRLEGRGRRGAGRGAALTTLLDALHAPQDEACSWAGVALN